MNLRFPRVRLFVSLGLLLLVATQGVPLLCVVARPFNPGKVALSTRAQFRWLEESLDDGDAAQAAMWPEGELFLWEFYALALQNVADTTGSGEDVERMKREARRMLPKMDAVLAHKPFLAMRHWDLRGGICWFAGQNLVRARLIERDASVGEEVERFHKDSAILARAFAASPSGVLEGHPGMSWPVDSLFGLQSLQIHDRLFGTAYFAPAYAKWKRTVTAGEDAATGLAPSFTHLDGRPRDVPRGCALSWSLEVLPFLDRSYARAQWSSYKTHFSTCRFGLCLFREYPKGHGREADADSGPMLAGYGMSATAFALAAARANGDVETAAALQRLGELGGAPLWTLSGRRYWFGAVPLFDVFSVWVTTVPMPEGTPAPSVFSVPTFGLAALLALVSLLLARSVRNALRALKGKGAASRAQRERADPRASAPPEKPASIAP